MDEKFLEEEAMYKVLVEQLPQKISLKDKNSVYISCNENYARDLGIKAEEIKGKTDYDFFPKELAKKYQADDKRIMNKEEPESMDEKYTHNGKEIFVHTAKVPVMDEQGNVLGVLGILWDITERNKAEKEVAFQAQIIQNMPTIVAYHDKDLNVIWVNNAYQKVTGLSLEEIKGKKCYHAWNLSKSCRGCPVLTAIETGEKATCELTSDNQDHWPETQGSWLCEATPIRDEHGAVIGAVEFAVNITERKEKEEVLKVSEEKLNSILNNMKDVVWSISWPDLTHNYISPSLEKLYGRSKQEFMDNPSLFKEVTHLDDQHLTEKAIKQLVEEGEAVRECRIVKPDGSIVWINDRSKMIYDEKHHPIRVDGVTQDITERKQKDEKLLELKAAVDQSADGIALTDMDGHIRFINDAWARMHGYSADELIGRHFSVFHTKKQMKKDVIPFNERLIAAGSNEGEIAHVRKDGTVFFTKMITTVVVGSDGNRIALLAIAHDITERRNMEKSLKKQKLSLEQKNLALKEMIEHAEWTKNRIKENTAINIDETIMPIVEKLQMEGASPKYIKLLRYHLSELASSFGRKITQKSVKLTPKEIEISSMIKSGISSKDLAELLNISLQTVEKHRKAIRKKLGISNKGVNLTTHLQSI